MSSHRLHLWHLINAITSYVSSQPLCSFHYQRPQHFFQATLCRARLTGGSTILVYPCKMFWQNFWWVPHNGSVECRWGVKNHNFRRTSRFVSETIHRKAIVTVECQLTGTRKQSIKWCHFQWPWTTLNPDFKGTSLLDIECLRNSKK